MNKDVCRHCMEKDPTFPEPWMASDEKLWKKGQVICPGIGLGWTIYNWNVAGNKTAAMADPPELCPFRLEHVVLGQENI